ncbi:hypothetical protein PENSPDRAFT_51759 [Peniophora sp. CONT]|nr:hypothetical protein PENSPDRAFT_51759 [Peniophora sp. CONT]
MDIRIVLIKFLGTSGLLGLVCASNLLSIRVAAVWSWDKRIIGILVTIAMIILAFGVYFMVELTSAYDPTLQSCNMSEVHNDLLPASAVFAGDCIVLALLLTGLQRNWREARQVKNRMWHILWTQGLLYLFTAAVVEVPVVVLLIMNINSIMNTMMITPVVIFLSMCATRMYRFLNKTVQGQSEMFTNGVSQGVISTVRDDEVQLTSIRNGSHLNTPRERV